MSLLNAPRADVIRNGSVKQISTEELVKDDVIYLPQESRFVRMRL